MSERYFHFPLCLLSLDDSVHDVLTSIITFSCVEMGKNLWQRFSPDDRHGRRSVPPDKELIDCKVDLTKDEQLQAVAGCEYLDVECSDIRRAVAEHTRLTLFVQEFERRHGTDARVRIRTYWVFEARDGGGMSYDELAVLVGIYSKIGATKRHVRITLDEIWRRASGYKSERVCKEEGAFMLGPHKRRVRSIVERLQARHFFARTTFARRESYYSHRLSTAELRQYVFTAKTHRARARKARIGGDADLTAQIRAERRKLAGPHATDTAADAPL